MSKSELTVDELADMFKALGHPHRLALFQRLASCCAPGTRCRTDQALRCCVGDLGQDLDIAPSTLSHHLKELNHAGLIRTQRKGRQVECWVDPEVLKRIGQFFNS